MLGCVNLVQSMQPFSLSILLLTLQFVVMPGPLISWMVGRKDPEGRAVWEERDWTRTRTDLLFHVDILSSIVSFYLNLYYKSIFSC